MADLTNLNAAVTANTAAVTDVTTVVNALRSSTDQSGVDAATAQIVSNTAALEALKPPPVITVTAISPATGGVAGGTSVTLTGSGFTGATSVTIGGVPTTSMVVVNDTTITAITGVGTAGASSVIVTGPTGNVNAANTLYTYA